MSLIPGDEVIYWAEIFDNSPDNQKGESRKYVARFPSIEEPDFLLSRKYIRKLSGKKKKNRKICEIF